MLRRVKSHHRFAGSKIKLFVLVVPSFAKYPFSIYEIPAGFFDVQLWESVQSFPLEACVLIYLLVLLRDFINVRCSVSKKFPAVDPGNLVFMICKCTEIIMKRLHLHYYG